jgi:hypothetical protein
MPGSASAKDRTNIHFSSPTRSADVPLGVPYGSKPEVPDCPAPRQLYHRLCCKSRFAQVVKDSAGPWRVIRGNDLRDLVALRQIHGQLR